ncbi:AraC family transcriptional regulator [Chryseotalea sanaruensis]|uniref:AraC family transcriptional regulator n=1 Tax=Chryseotalea sanaruensis TaxID=2482724 RepID=A0A401UF80_9BACT|nr:helix-turn-helix domain-containing protein [Chryseotalea sanaruensis]GCC53510.1 AraC family transcriptional regulator [Chryseotalea sanaruensis]
MPKEIKSYRLDNQYLFIHKEAITDSDFGLDNTAELIDNGFGIYSSVRVKNKIGPLKSEFYRVAMCRRGFVTVDCGLETFTHQRNTIHFNFPSQLFSLYNKSDDMFAYYILFTEKFIEDILPLNSIQQQFPFLDYEGVPFFQLTESESTEIEELFFKIDNEIKRNQKLLKQAIQLYIKLILIAANRSYERQKLAKKVEPKKDGTVVTRFKKLVGQHFLTKRSVSDYASILAITPNHLSKLVKEQSGKTASSFIEEMLLMEAKALLRHTELTISEIAYQLNFSDPSHFNKFFKKGTALTPLRYRNQK